MEFVDLQAQRARIGAETDAAIGRVLAHGRFIMGPEVVELEEELCSYTGARRCVTCSSGTDALLMVLLAWGIGPGDAVFVPSFTFAATVEVVVLVGATPVFVDIDGRTFNMDAASLSGAIDLTERAGLRLAAVIGVDLFGLPADWEAIRKVTEPHGARVLADGAQSFGASVQGGRVGTLADATITSFFPAKPLGCYGDGGAVFTDDEELAVALRSIRVHGQGGSKYDNVRIGINGRLDTLQAAILLAKLTVFDEELSRRQGLAERYSRELSEHVVVPVVPEGFASAWAQYTIRMPRRDRVRAALTEARVPTAVYYPKALHQQPAFASALRTSQLDASESVTGEVLSLPIHPYLSEADQTRVIAALREATRSN